jgi:signal transduction histidine kinase
VDAGRVTQVIGNLLENAVKYSDPPAAIVCALVLEDGFAEVRVTDQGHGIAPEDMDRLFTRFGRVITAENSHVPGVGLGLYLGRRVARMHGGELSAESEPGQGSTFVLRLPLRPLEEEIKTNGRRRLPVADGLRSAVRRLPSRARE